MNDGLAEQIEQRPHALQEPSSLPPTMMASVAAAAPAVPPETGASSMSTPRAASPCAMRRATDGAMVLMSTTTLPGAAPCAMPFVAQRHLFDVGIRGNDGEHDVGMAGDLRRRLTDPGAAIDQRRKRFGTAREDGQFVPAAQQVPRHRAPHRAQSDESEPENRRAARRSSLPSGDGHGAAVSWGRTHAALPAGQPLVELEHADRIVLAQAAAGHRVEHLRGRSGSRQRDAEAVRFVEHDAQVLLMHPGLEAGLEVARQHASAMVVENAAGGEAAKQGFAHPPDVDAVDARKIESFGNHRHRCAGHHLIAGFRHLSGAGIADQGDRLAQAFEQRAHPLERLVPAADHDGQRSADRPRLAARDRRIEHVDTALGQAQGNAACRAGRDRAHVDEHVTWCGTGRNAPLAERNLFDIRRIGHHAETDFRVSRHLRGAVAGDCTRVEQGLHRFRAARPDMQAMPGLEQIQRHRPAHDAETDKSDFHRSSRSLCDIVINRMSALSA